MNFQFRLSGESPFLCESEADTFSRITDARWEFTDVFDYVSKEAKDFITRLLLKDPKYLLILDYIYEIVAFYTATWVARKYKFIGYCSSLCLWTRILML